MVITLNSFVLDCLFPLQLVPLLGFYLVHSSGTYFSVTSFAVLISNSLVRLVIFPNLQ